MPDQLQASESPKNLQAILDGFPALRAPCPAMDSSEREPFGNAALRCERATSEKFREASCNQLSRTSAQESLTCDYPENACVVMLVGC